MQGRVPTCSGSPSCCSSRCAIPQKGRSYKRIENFLKRIAFNLGNSASQTDVKILSCIPLDVTDLQQRITQLEKELQDAKDTKNKDKEDKKDKKKKKDKVDKGDEEDVECNEGSGSKRGSKANEGKDGNGGSRRCCKECERKVDKGGSRRCSKASKAEGGKEAEKEETFAWMEKSKVTKASKVGGNEAENEGATGFEERKITETHTSSQKNYIQDYLNEETNKVHPMFTANTDNKFTDTGRLNIVNSAGSSSVDRGPGTQQSSTRIKKQKHNPFSVFMGNLKRCKHSNAKKYSSNFPYDEFGYSASSFSITACPMSKTNDHEGRSESENKYSNFQTFTERKKKPNKVKDKSSNRHNHFIYYAQTDSHFNPIYKTKQDNKGCDMLYIANLIEKQYGSTGLLTEKNGLHRQYSMPMCHDKGYFCNEYPINSYGPRSCFAGPNSRYDINRGLIDNSDTDNNLRGFSQDNYYSCQNKGRFYDCTQYDMVPVKQKASKKHSDQAKYDGVGHKSDRSGSPGSKSCYPDIEPPLNLHPSHSYDMIRNSKRSQHQSCLDRSLHRRKARSHMIKKHSPECPQKSTNKQKISTDPEDIYLQSANISEPASAKGTHEKIIKTQVKPDIKSNEIKEIKAMLEDFLTEFRKDIPKLLENLTAKPEDYQVFTPKPSVNQCAFVPGFTQMIPAGQCYPLLCPYNLMTSSHTAHACVHRTPTLHKEPSECCITKTKSDVDTPKNQDSLSETNKLIKEIYKSVALQNVHNEFNTKAVDANGNETMKHIVNSSSTMPSSISQELQQKSSLNPSPSNRKLGEQTTETDSKEQNLRNGSYSSVHTDFSVLCNENAREPSVTKIKIEKKGTFSRFMQAFKLSFTKTKEINSEIGNPSCRHNAKQFQSSSHQKRHPSSKMYGNNHTTNRPIRTNTGNPEDKSKCCYIDSKQLSGQCPEHHHERPQYSNPKSIRRHQDPRPFIYESDEPRNCFYIAEPQQIPFCLKEIEVRNVSTQVKKKKLFGILRRLTHATDSDTSFEQIPPRARANYKAATGYVPVRTGYKMKKPSFWELLKGQADFDYDKINKHNLTHDSSESIEAKPGKHSFFSPKHNSPMSKKAGKLTKYMHKVEKAKKRDMTRNMLNKNPVSFKNILMKTLIGHNPNTKPARPFF